MATDQEAAGVARDLANARESAGVSLRELSRRTGINAWQLAAIERGERDPQLSTVERIVGGLGLVLVLEVPA